MSTQHASGTPRTDAALENWDSGNKATEWARRLERELAEKERELAGTMAEVKRLRDAYGKLLTECAPRSIVENSPIAPDLDGLPAFRELPASAILKMCKREVITNAQFETEHRRIKLAMEAARKEIDG
ncbi:MAG: hypothetical protein Q7Q73_07400 [Verrucomicrobiota bacterium JB024]|nr:hypothetical protein [Verrucomicrobiota bacterium JB024]